MGVRQKTLTLTGIMLEGLKVAKGYGKEYLRNPPIG